MLNIKPFRVAVHKETEFSTIRQPCLVVTMQSYRQEEEKNPEIVTEIETFISSKEPALTTKDGPLFSLTFPLSPETLFYMIF